MTDNNPFKDFKKKQGALKKAFTVAKKSKWTLAMSAAGLMIGIPVVPGVLELGMIAAGGIKDIYNHGKEKSKPSKNKYLQPPKK